MKTYIYISGFVVAFLLLGWLMAYLLGMPNHLIMLVGGSIVLLLVYLPLVVAKRRQHRNRMKEIIRNYQQQEKENRKRLYTQDAGQAEKSSKNRKGWSMNDSPYRERKSGVTWGGGNIHAANASRDSRKRRK